LKAILSIFCQALPRGCLATREMATAARRESSPAALAVVPQVEII